MANPRGAQSLTVKSLDGLRGLAVLLVLLSHMSLAGLDLFPGLDFSGIGKAGVYLFFVLSAFLLTLQALEKNQGALITPKYWSGYLLRRILRIYPLYFVALMASFFISQTTEGYITRIESPVDVLAHLGLLAGNHIYWAIPVEFKYYLLLPVVVLIFVIANRVHWSLTLTVTLAGLALVNWLWPAEHVPVNTISIWPYLSIFLLGSLCAAMCRSSVATYFKNQPRLLGILGWAAILCGLATVPALWRFIAEPEAANHVFHRAFLFYGVIWGVTVLAAMYGAGFFVRAFEFEALRFVGRVSFSAYLWHYPIVQLFARDVALPGTLEFVIAMTLIIGVSYLSYRFIERPFIAWGHHRTQDW